MLEYRTENTIIRTSFKTQRQLPPLVPKKLPQLASPKLTVRLFEEESICSVSTQDSILSDYKAKVLSDFYRTNETTERTLVTAQRIRESSQEALRQARQSLQSWTDAHNNFNREMSELREHIHKPLRKTVGGGLRNLKFDSDCTP